MRPIDLSTTEFDRWLGAGAPTGKAFESWLRKKPKKAAPTKKAAPKKTPKKAAPKKPPKKAPKKPPKKAPKKPPKKAPAKKLRPFDLPQTEFDRWLLAMSRGYPSGEFDRWLDGGMPIPRKKDSPANLIRTVLGPESECANNRDGSADGNLRIVTDDPTVAIKDYRDDIQDAIASLDPRHYWIRIGGDFEFSEGIVHGKTLGDRYPNVLEPVWLHPQRVDRVAEQLSAFSTMQEDMMNTGHEPRSLIFHIFYSPDGSRIRGN